VHVHVGGWGVGGGVMGKEGMGEGEGEGMGEGVVGGGGGEGGSGGRGGVWREVTRGFLVERGWPDAGELMKLRAKEERVVGSV
jgi:hypothetical protein